MTTIRCVIGDDPTDLGPVAIGMDLQLEGIGDQGQFALVIEQPPVHPIHDLGQFIGSRNRHLRCRCRQRRQVSLDRVQLPLQVGVVDLPEDVQVPQTSSALL